MELDISLTDDLWTTISDNYQNGNYAGAIIDSILFLCKILREKSGLELDGAALVGGALGGKDPPIKLTKMQTQSAKDEQAGYEQIARGLVQGIRNPRSHEKRTDAKQDADAIIAFVDHFLRKVALATVPFETASFIGRIFDEDFVLSERYAQLLIEEIPVQKRADVLYQTYAQKETGKPAYVGLFLSTLMASIPDDDRAEFTKTVSDEMKRTTSEPAIRAIVTIFAEKQWSLLEEAARLRIENKLLKSTFEGKYNLSSGSLVSGALGTWIIKIANNIQLKDRLIKVLVTKLNSTNKQEQDYVFKQFGTILLELETPSAPLVRVIKTGLQKGDHRFYDLVAFAVEFTQAEWTAQIKTEYDAFEDKPTDTFEDDIPF